MLGHSDWYLPGLNFTIISPLMPTTICIFLVRKLQDPMCFYPSFCYLELKLLAAVKTIQTEGMDYALSKSFDGFLVTVLKIL